LKPRPLEQLLSVAELAREAGVSHRRMKYRLKRLDAQRGGLIVRLSESPTGKIFVRKSALKKHAPELLEIELATSQEVDDIRRDIHVLQRQVNGVAANVRELNAFRRKSHDWFHRPTKSDQNRPM